MSRLSLTKTATHPFLLALLLACSHTSLDAMSMLPLPTLGHSTTAAAPLSPPASGMADRVVVKKGERRLYLMQGDRPIRSYPIALGFKPTGHKRQRGDGRTPEGRYQLDWKNPQSSFHKSLHVSYPNQRDRMRAAFRGVAAGGMIMIHGQPNRRRPPDPIEGDWTQGCIAVSNEAIDDIWRLTASGTPIEILP
ncbi:L,D-transpeptidase family protein [Thiocystis violacea]|uniref:L,D-transpeptidase family protein n=1 Tax=Thiocystis violacea TaxID=13725 RepID=UPI0019078130|nr:L,D-transpeptidase family protein [Thiocystis violacea]MBK1722834.1 hypothetical protein [Thiocystis violacea]